MNESIPDVRVGVHTRPTHENKEEYKEKQIIHYPFSYDFQKDHPMGVCRWAQELTRAHFARKGKMEIHISVIRLLFEAMSPPLGPKFRTAQGLYDNLDEAMTAWHAAHPEREEDTVAQYKHRVRWLLDHYRTRCSNPGFDPVVVFQKTWRIARDDAKHPRVVRLRTLDEAMAPVQPAPAQPAPKAAPAQPAPVQPAPKAAPQRQLLNDLRVSIRDEGGEKVVQFVVDPKAWDVVNRLARMEGTTGEASLAAMLRENLEGFFLQQRRALETMIRNIQEIL